MELVTTLCYIFVKGYLLATGCAGYAPEFIKPVVLEEGTFERYPAAKSWRPILRHLKVDGYKTQPSKKKPKRHHHHHRLGGSKPDNQVHLRGGDIHPFKFTNGVLDGTAWRILGL